MTRKNRSKTEGRNPDGTFATGNPGRPKGARHKTTLAVEALLEGEHEALTQAAISKALEGDVTAIRLCLDRIAPARKDNPISFELPDIKTADDAANAARGLLKALAEGEVTPLEAASVMGVIENFRRVLETTDFEKRIAALEAKQ